MKNFPIWREETYYICKDELNISKTMPGIYQNETDLSQRGSFVWDQGGIQSFWRDKILRALAYLQVHLHESCQYQMYSHIYCVPAWRDRWIEIALCPSSPAVKVSSSCLQPTVLRIRQWKPHFMVLWAIFGDWGLNPTFNLEIFKNRIIFPFFSLVLEVRATRHMTKLRGL